MTSDAARQLMELYPRIYFACHARHVRDPRTRRLLSAHQASILDHLDEREPLTLVDLARHMGVTPSTMSLDRKSTRLNSSHGYISYAVFCLKKKKTTPHGHTHLHHSSLSASSGTYA